MKRKQHTKLCLVVLGCLLSVQAYSQKFYQHKTSQCNSELVGISTMNAGHNRPITLSFLANSSSVYSSTINSNSTLMAAVPLCRTNALETVIGANRGGVGKNMPASIVSQRVVSPSMDIYTVAQGKTHNTFSTFAGNVNSDWNSSARKTDERGGFSQNSFHCLANSGNLAFRKLSEPNITIKGLTPVFYAAAEPDSDDDDMPSGDGTNPLDPSVPLDCGWVLYAFLFGYLFVRKRVHTQNS